MESDIGTLTTEMKNYYLQITKANNDNSLTTIQKNAYNDSIRKKIESQGIKYFLSYDSDNNSNYHSILFQSPPWQVKGIGKIKDISIKGAFPFSLSIDNNISIHFDPRNLKDKDSSNWNDLKNNAFINFQKDNDYEFQGKISYCRYYFATKPERFEFAVIGGASLNDNCFVATACYGNYNAPQVLVLRQYRDEKLLKTFFGKAFVKFYYTVSPFFAKQISKSDLLKKFIRQYLLEPFITKLLGQNKS